VRAADEGHLRSLAKKCTVSAVFLLVSRFKKSGSVSRVLYPAGVGGRRPFILTNCYQLVLPIYQEATYLLAESAYGGFTLGPSNPAAWSCRRWGLPCQRRYRPCGALLPHHFTIACARKGTIGCIFSVALSRGLPRVAVSHHRALSCPDFPPPFLSSTEETGATARPTLFN